MSDGHDATRTRLTEERDGLVSRINELTVGGETDLGFDDEFADRGQVASEQGEHRLLADSLQIQLGLVEKALARLEEGTYGTCEVCGEPIGEERLAAMPATARCLNHA